MKTVIMRVLRVVPKTEIYSLIVPDRIASVRWFSYQIEIALLAEDFIRVTHRYRCGISLQNIRQFGHRTAKLNVKRLAGGMGR